MIPQAPDAKHGVKTGAVLVTLLAFAFLALIVFPGLLAALFARAGSGLVMFSDQYTWIIPGDLARTRIVQTVFYPSEEMMRHSAAARRFYIWQYELAGGKVEMLAGK